MKSEEYISIKMSSKIIAIVLLCILFSFTEFLLIQQQSEINHLKMENAILRNHINDLDEKTQKLDETISDLNSRLDDLESRVESLE